MKSVALDERLQPLRERPHNRPLDEIQRDLIRLLEAAARREPTMWGVFPAYQPIEERYPTEVPR